MDLLKNALDFAKQRFEHDASGHDFHHTVRVYRTAIYMAEQENADKEIVALAAILHDVDDAKLFGTPMGSTESAHRFLVEHHVDSTTIDAIEEIIRTLSFKGTDSKACESLEGKIVQDADRLDAIGAIGIARAFAFGGSRQRVIHDPEQKPDLSMNQSAYTKNKGTTINHFFEKLLLLKDQMNTPTARRIAERRHGILVKFMDDFFKEWESEDVKNEEKL